MQSRVPVVKWIPFRAQIETAPGCLHTFNSKVNLCLKHSGLDERYFLLDWRIFHLTGSLRGRQAGRERGPNASITHGEPTRALSEGLLSFPGQIKDVSPTVCWTYAETPEQDKKTLRAVVRWLLRRATTLSRAEICLWMWLLSYLSDMLRNRAVRYKQLYLDRSSRLLHSALAFGLMYTRAIGCFFALALEMLDLEDARD